MGFHASNYDKITKPSEPPLDVVVFRMMTYDDGQQEILALFPKLPWSSCGTYCTSYAARGQHSGADYDACMRRSRAATPNEYEALAKELTGQGYNLKIQRRRPPKGAWG